MLKPTSRYTVIESDEFDRSFLRLSPFSSIITSADPDHLDIYGDATHFREGFEMYANLHPENGIVVQKYGLNLPTKAKVYTYGIEQKDADFNGVNLRYVDEQFWMDVVTPFGFFEAIELGVPVVTMPKMQLLA
ncbi:MAG: hypothetical protein R2779_10450 [Crocinitomicaceae bacterium]